jgi:hypothetical protein
MSKTTFMTQGKPGQAFRGAEKRQIVNTDRLDEDKVKVSYSDNKTSMYTAQQLLQLSSNRNSASIQDRRAGWLQNPTDCFDECGRAVESLDSVGTR